MKWNNFYSNNGSLLLVSTPLIFTDVNEIGFKAIPNSFRGIEHYYSGNYGFPKRQLFTEIQFVMGLKKEQFFIVTHRQVVNKHVSLAIDYRRIKSDGYLNRQTSEGLNFSASLTQKYANERYNIYTRGYYEKIVLQENGGILDVAQVDNKSFVSKQLLDITLPQAKNYKQVRGGEIENRWNFGNLVEVKKDTVISKKVVPTSAIWHKIAYSEINRVYKDTLPGAYYERYYFDADSTNDKFFNFITENYLGWKTLENKRGGEKRKMFFSSNLKYEHIDHWQNRTKIIIDNVILQSDLQSAEGNWNINGAYVASGYNVGDFLLSGDYTKLLFDSSRYKSYLRATATYKSQEVAYTFNHFVSNNFVWYNNYSKINTAKFSIDFSMPRYDVALSINAYSISNLVFLGLDQHPLQANVALQVITVMLNKDFKLGYFHFNNLLCYQATNSYAVANIPQFVSKHSLYFQKYIFKNAMDASIGIDVNYFSGYYANAYSPALNQFYVQQSYITGNYTQADFFISFKVKTVRAFVRVDNINNYIMHANYYIVPLYPMQGTTLKLGVNWRFLN